MKEIKKKKLWCLELHTLYMDIATETNMEWLDKYSQDILGVAWGALGYLC